MQATNRSYFSIAGLAIQSVQTRTASGQIGHDPTLGAAKAGSLTTRTDDNTGIVTCSEGHGIQSLDVVDVYWADGVRYGMVATVTVNAVAVEGGAGEALPAQATAVTVGVTTNLDTDFDGDLLEMIAAHSTKRAMIVFLDVDDVVLKAVELTAGEAWAWSSGGDIANPLTGNPVAYVLVSNGDSAAAAAVKLGILYSSS